MSSFNIGLSGLTAAQRAIENIGTNIANVSTAGYHRQELVLAPESYGGSQNTNIGGVRVQGINRSLDVLLESQLLSQRPSMGQVNQELTVLQQIQTALGETSSKGLGAAINQFFNSLQEAAGQPNNYPQQEQLVRDAEGMVMEFHNLASFFNELQNQIVLQAKDAVSQINNLTTQIASLNGQLSNIGLASTGGSNILKDQRDQAISQLADLVDVHTDAIQGSQGQASVQVCGTPVVTNAMSVNLQVGVMAGNQLAVSFGGGESRTDITGGTLGALVALQNGILTDVKNQIDTLAQQFISRFNDLHAQGVGSAGSFSELTGWPVGSGTLATWNPPVTDGSVYVRVTNRATGAVTRTKIDVDADQDTAATLATKFDGVAHLNGSIVASQLHLEADNGYSFDFIPALTPTPTTSTLTGTAAPTISGLYTGGANQTYTFKVVSAGDVGVSDNVQVEVRNEAGELVKTLNVGKGYPAGDALEVFDGIHVAFGAGSLRANETFTVLALADTDTSGLLAGAGLNAFFTGTDARSLDIAQDLVADPGRLAFAGGQDMTDNQIIAKMAALQTQQLPELGGISFEDSHTQLTTTVGQQILVRQSRQASLQGLIQQLTNQRDQISGVDINEESAKLIVFEKLFQSMARYVSTVDKTTQSLIDMIS